MPTARPFYLPHRLSYEEQTTFCLQIIKKQREELYPLRKKVTNCQTYHNSLIDQLKQWEKKSKRKNRKRNAEKRD